jgi:hypothetical protein
MKSLLAIVVLVLALPCLAHGQVTPPKTAPRHTSAAQVQAPPAKPGAEQRTEPRPFNPLARLRERPASGRYWVASSSSGTPKRAAEERGGRLTAMTRPASGSSGTPSMRTAASRS